MKPETFFDNFEVLAEAPNGVKKLREMILQLAVRGKLVAQDEKDEPAYNLLKRIKFKKGQLIKENKIKNIEALAPINKTEVPYFLPEGWDWAHIGDLILSITGGGTPSKNNPQFWNGNIPWASVKDLGKSKYLETTIDFISEKGVQNSSTNLIPKGRVIICTRMGLGKIVINKIDVAINQDLKAIELPEEFNENYFYNFYITQNIKGSGMTVSGIRQTELLNILVPVPPLAEQHRIVAKVDQLMSLCDELEARQQKKREIRAHINSAALDRLLAARAPGEFAEGWRRISNNFDLLYDAPENVGALRQSILQLAVMGKLVAQDENDEPASFLLEKIRIRKEKMIKEKKKRKSESLKPIELDEMPNEVPSGWEWGRLGNLCFNITDGFHNTPKPKISGVPYITAQHIRPNFIDFNNCLYVSEKDHKDLVSKTRPTKKDLLLVNIGAGCGTPAIINVDFEFSFKNVAIFNKPEEINSGYLYYYLLLKRSSFFEQLTKGGAQPFLSLSVLRNIPFPLPPLAEQNRIVARVDQLMSLCDQLEAGLRRSQADSENLMEAVVGKMLAGGDSA